MTNTTIDVFQEILLLVTSNTCYDKSTETSDLVPCSDTSIFIQLDTQLSKLSTLDDELLAGEIDYISPLLLFLLEHLPLEIDLNLLTSTETDDHQLSLATTAKIYRPNLFPSKEVRIQYTSESRRILDHLFQILRLNNFQELLHLQQHSKPIYLRCFHLLTPLLLKTTYDKYPVAVEIFVHIVKSMNQISLTETFDLIFPVCLMTLDDPSIEMKFISLSLIDQFQRHCTSTELQLFNRVNVIMYGLEQNLHRRGDRAIFFECLLATTYRWLIILENETYAGRHLFIRTSQLIERFIRDALLEINIEYRRLILRILEQYIIRLQLFAVRHFNHLLELIDDSIDHRLLRKASLQILWRILRTLQPRINAHRYDIMKIIIRSSFQIVHEDRENTSILHLLKESLKEFHSLTTENYVQDALQSLVATTQLDLSFRECLQQLLETIQESV